MQSRETVIRNAVVLVLLIVGVSIFSMVRETGNADIRISTQDRDIVLRGSHDTSAMFRVDQLETLDYVDAAGIDWGVAIDGGETRGNRYGSWKNDSLGEYEAFFSTGIGSVIVLRDAEKTAVFNTENENTTLQLYEQMMDL